jgi:hypothetical protein
MVMRTKMAKSAPLMISTPRGVVEILTALLEARTRIVVQKVSRQMCCVVRAVVALHLYTPQPQQPTRQLQP